MENIAPPENWIVHLCTRQDWQAAQLAGEYRADSLKTEGFIHCSRPEQIVSVANLFYRDVPHLVLLWIDPAGLLAPLRWEAVGEQVFPHLFGPLNLAAIMAARDYLPDADGVFRQAPGLSL